MATWDVVKEYDWTSAPKGSKIRQDAPVVWLRAYELKSNQIAASLANYENIANSNQTADEFYKNMYGGAVRSGDEFRFPYFNDGLRSFTNTFGDTFQNGIGGSGGIGGMANDFIKEGAGVLGQVANQGNWKDVIEGVKEGDWGKIKAGLNNGNPGTYIETPVFYQFEKNDGPLEISFALSNTINGGSVEQNQKLIEHLTRINRPLRKNSIAVDPPRIYTIRVPGQRFIQWASCTSFSVSFLGNRRIINGNVTPEGWQLNMGFTSLTIEHAGFMDKIH